MKPKWVEVISMSNNNAKKIGFKKSAILFGSIIKRMFKFSPALLVLACVTILISGAAGVIGSAFIGSILIDDFITPMLSNQPTYLYGIPMSLETVILIMVGIYLIGVVTNYIYQIVVSQIGQGTQKEIRDELFSHMESLPLSYFDTRTHGDIMSVYTNDIDTLREFISRVLPMVVSSIVTMVAALVAMLVLNVYLTLIVLFFFVIIITCIGIFSHKSSTFFISQQRSLGMTNGYIEEMISGQKVIKVFTHEKESEEGFDKLNDALCGYTTKAQQFSNILGPITVNLAHLQYCVIALVGGLLMGYGVMSIKAGLIISFLTLGKSFTLPIGQVANQINLAIMALAGAERIFALIDEPSEVDDGYVMLVNAKKDENGNPIPCEEKTNMWAWEHPHTDGSPTSYTWLRGDITMSDVDFAYVKGKTVLHDVTLYAKPGQKVAFVGPTGAGKTTITNLLNRFYDIEDGKIRFDGININKIKKKDLRRAMGMVLQETNLFTGSVKDNIRYGNPSASDEEVIKAAKLANAHNFIMMLPEGYDTILHGAGAGLSQGQRQLISIARAACANPPVLVLDEATSSIDSHTEKLVQNGMDAIMKGRTVFVIAHRLSTIQNSDVIMVLESGKIIERGNHEDLLKQKGKYYQLYTGSKAKEANA